MEEYWPDLDRFEHICRDLARFRPKFGQISSPYSEPKTDKTRSGRFEAPHGSVVGFDFSHPSLLGRVRVGHKPDLGRLVDTHNVQLIYFVYILCIHFCWCSILMFLAPFFNIMCQLRFFVFHMMHILGKDLWYFWCLVAFSSFKIWRSNCDIIASLWHYFSIIVAVFIANWLRYPSINFHSIIITIFENQTFLQLKC